MSHENILMKMKTYKNILKQYSVGGNKHMTVICTELTFYRYNKKMALQIRIYCTVPISNEILTYKNKKFILDKWDHL